jgi:hypothetical protein
VEVGAAATFTGGGKKKCFQFNTLYRFRSTTASGFERLGQLSGLCVVLCGHLAVGGM